MACKQRSQDSLFWMGTAGNNKRTIRKHITREEYEKSKVWGNEGWRCRKMGSTAHAAACDTSILLTKWFKQWAFSPTSSGLFHKVWVSFTEESNRMVKHLKEINQIMRHTRKMPFSCCCRYQLHWRNIKSQEIRKTSEKNLTEIKQNLQRSR